MYYEDEFKGVPIGTKLWCHQLGECNVVIERGQMPVCVENTDGEIRTFHLNGRLYKSDIYPTLFWKKPTDADPYPARPKRQGKREVTAYVNVYASGDSRVHLTRGQALEAVSEGAIAVAVKCIGHYEVEE